ncbi:MAG: zinc-binding dehydrogenase, partial [Myxococcales bacterium]|nr:zinc-binding dehydrogenase [Myxococcales bacterium]
NSIGSGNWVGALPSVAFGALFRSKQWRTVDYVPSRKNLEDLGALLASGAVKVVIDKSYALAQAGDAVAHMVSRRARGQIVISTG